MSQDTWAWRCPEHESDNKHTGQQHRVLDKGREGLKHVARPVAETENRIEKQVELTVNPSFINPMVSD